MNEIQLSSYPAQGQFSALFANRKFTDITLLCSEGEIKCHKAVLYCASTFFQRVLDQNSPLQLMFLRDVSILTLECIVRLIYLGSVQTPIDLHDVKTLARELGIDVIQTHAANTKKKSKKRRRSSAETSEVTPTLMDNAASNVQPVEVDVSTRSYLLF